MISWQDMARLVRALARQRLGEREERVIRTLARPALPWDRVATLTRMEGVAGLAYRHLKELDLLERVPSRGSDALEKAYRDTTARTRLALAQAEAVSRLCERSGLEAVALQGLSLVPALYPDPGTRHLSDLDLMVRKAQKEPLKRVLTEAGFRPVDPAYPDLLVREGVPVDLHTHLLNVERIRGRERLFPGSLEPMWERAGPLFQGSVGLRALHPADNLVALAAHALKHGYSRLFWIMDLREWAMERFEGPKAWEEAAQRARLWRQGKVLAYGLLLASRVFEWPIPRPAQEGLGLARLDVVEKHLIRLKARGMPSEALGGLLSLKSVQGMGGRLELVLGTLFPEREVLAQVAQGMGWRGRRFRRLRRIGAAGGAAADLLMQAARFSSVFGRKRGMR